MEGRCGVGMGVIGMGDCRAHRHHDTIRRSFLNRRYLRHELD
jgi:hypothetical protein